MKPLSSLLFFVFAVSIAGHPLGAAEKLPLAGPRKLPAGGSLALEFELSKPQATAVRITFADADFSGATILTQVNGKNLPPYHAFGGDTRYDNVRGKAGLNPPIAKIEANHVLVTQWVQAGANQLTVRNVGPGSATIGAVSVRPVSGHDLPRYENSIYFDFDVWRQASVMRPGIHAYLDTMLLGIIPGGGAHVMNLPEGPILPVKMEAEKARVAWGFGRSTFYSIWHLCMTADKWANFINVDGMEDPKPKPDDKDPPRAKIHVQFANPPVVPPGTDIALIKPDGYLQALKVAIDDLAPYSSDYNLTCEQWGPRGQGFGRWWGDKWAKQGYDAKRWADNYQTEFGKVTRYIHERNPGAPVMAPHWWIGDIRFLMYDTSVARGFKMGDMTDSFMTHYYSFPFAAYKPDGSLVMDDDAKVPPVAQPELEYPGGKFEPPDWEKSRPYMGTWALIPEIAIDWNRYRLSRSEKDMKLGNPKVNRWKTGKPFNFAAGFDGDERSYNNETCVYDRNYSGPAPYQFLYSMFSYSLLPSAASEPKDFKITRTLPLKPQDKVSEDIFTEVSQPINMYGKWIEGAAGTHRLKTQDPLYGDLFGYTGFEQATTGDYIWLCGIKERHHRREPHNAWNLVRRTCYAFVTAGPVYPAIVNDEDSNHLFIKTLLVKQDGRDVIGVYAVNFHDQPHKLDLTLPVGWTQATAIQAFDERAWDWSQVKEGKLTPRDGGVRVHTNVPARSPRCLFIYPPAGEAYRTFANVRVPEPLSPWGNVNVPAPNIELKWRTGGPGAQYEAQLAREMLFRDQDIVTKQGPQKELFWKVAATLEPNRRYHFRVRAIDPDGNSSGWSAPQSFWYQAVAGSPAVAVSGDAPALQTVIPKAEGPLELKPFTDADNLAHRGTYFSHPNYWEGAAEAVDGLAASEWLPDDGEERKVLFPAWWAVRFDEEQPVARVALLWTEGKIAKDFDIQTWDGKAWQTAKSIRGNAAASFTADLDKPARTRAVRIWITAANATSIGLAEAYLH